MAQDKKVEQITNMEDDFAQWYTDICRKAELVEYASVKGFTILRPYGYAIWENIQRIMDGEFKKTGHEQRLPDEQRAVLSHPEYHFIQLFDGAEFVGLLLYWEAEDFRYVEHFCVRPELRGRRYGAKALEELGRDGKTVVLEIDPPVDDIARRRQGFYQRCGFAVNPYPHVHPPYRPEYPGHELVVLSSPRALTPAEYGAFACYLSAVVMA